MTCEDCLHFIVCDALESNGIEKIHPIQCGCFEDKEKVKVALEKQIPKFVECPKGFQGVRDTRFYCPNCNSLTRQKEQYCHKCGQAVKYPKEVYIKAENRITLEWGDGE